MEKLTRQEFIEKSKLIMKQELYRIYQVMISKYQVISTLNTAKRDILPLIGIE